MFTLPALGLWRTSFAPFIWMALSAGDCPWEASAFNPFMACSAEPLLSSGGRVEPVSVCELAEGSQGRVNMLPVCPFAPALTRSCWRFRASLSTDIATEPAPFCPPNFNVIFEGSGDLAGILSFTRGCGGSETTRFASVKRRWKYSYVHCQRDIMQ